MNLLVKLKKLRLLLIDDDEWIRDSMRLYFEGEGCDLVTLETAEKPFKTETMEESLSKLLTRISYKEANHVG